MLQAPLSTSSRCPPKNGKKSATQGPFSEVPWTPSGRERRRAATARRCALGCRTRAASQGCRPGHRARASCHSCSGWPCSTSTSEPHKRTWRRRSIRRTPRQAARVRPSWTTWSSSSASSWCRVSRAHRSSIVQRWTPPWISPRPHGYRHQSRTSHCSRRRRSGVASRRRRK